MSDGEKDEKVAMLAESGTTPSSPKRKITKRTSTAAEDDRVLQLQGMLEEAEREIQDLQAMMLEERMRAAATLASATSTAAASTAAAVEATSPQHRGMGIEIEGSRKGRGRGDGNTERAARRVAMLQEECDAAQKNLAELRAEEASSPRG